jgi:predicted NBD/HSP70 family sugar kinase
MTTVAQQDRMRPVARQRTLRENNLRLVLRTVLAAPAPVSRADVAAATSMTRSTVSRLVDELVSAGILAEVERPSGRRPGRPATPLVAGSRCAALGLQVNATFLAARVIDLGGRTLAEQIDGHDLVGSDPARTLSAVGALARRLLPRLPGDLRLVGAGLALPGIVAADSCRLLNAPNLGWSDLDPPSLLPPEHLDGLRVRAGNEADLAALTVAEVAPGRPGRFSDFIYLSGEIGIGGAAVLHGQVLGGRHGWAGEIGHVCVDPQGPTCRCGSTGCLEQYAGRNALLRAAGLPATSSPQELAARAADGDPVAREALRGAASALAVALAGAVNLLDIPTIVLGGHLGQVADLLRPDLEARLASRVLSARWVAPTVATADGDAAPGATGAAHRELSEVVADPARWIG